MKWLSPIVFTFLFLVSASFISSCSGGGSSSGGDTLGATTENNPQAGINTSACVDSFRELEAGKADVCIETPFASVACGTKWTLSYAGYDAGTDSIVAGDVIKAGVLAEPAEGGSCVLPQIAVRRGIGSDVAWVQAGTADWLFWVVHSGDFISAEWMSGNGLI